MGLASRPRVHTRAILLAVFAFSGGCDRSGAPPESPQPSDKTSSLSAAQPNVIFIFVDDQAPNTLGLEGNPHVRTPRLDRLATEGAYFSRAYLPIPQCAPSRAAVLTGLYPHQNGVITNEDARLPPDAVTFSQRFKERGYACGLIGKWHLSDPDLPQAGFEDYWVSYTSPGQARDPRLWIDRRLVQHEGYTTDILTDYAIDFVKTRADKPFMLWLVYKAPHGPIPMPKDPRFAYERDEMPLPFSMSDDLSTKPAPQRESIMHSDYLKWGPDIIRDRLSYYYSMISGVDLNVGRLLDTLDELKLSDNTLVIYMSDNGFLHGEHQMVTKGAVFYEEVVRSPLIMRWPARIKPGTRVHALVSSLDLFPTMGRLAGLRLPDGLPGKDILPLVDDPSLRLHDALYFEYTTKERNNKTVPMRGLVTDRHKYTRYLDDGEELYDLEADPHEMNNLIVEPSEAETADRLRARLVEWQASTGDTR